MRATVACSAAALLLAVAATQWLSERSADDPLLVSRHTTSRAAAATAHPHRPLHHVRPPLAAVSAAAVATAPAREMALVPVSMPQTGVPYARLRGHLDGQVTLQVQVDAGGQVLTASVGRGSGDAVLDAYALTTVRQWRFAVPADHPAGVGGTVSMRFASQRDGTQVP